jgi:hypothetical protein
VLTTTVSLRYSRNFFSDAVRPAIGVAAFGAEDRFVSAFQLGFIRDRGQFSRRFIAAPETLYKRKIDPHYSKTFPDELVQCDAGS